jgi:hypothetical protein
LHEQLEHDEDCDHLWATNMTLIHAGQDPDALLNFLRMEKWLADRPDHTGAAA